MDTLIPQNGAPQLDEEAERQEIGQRLHEKNLKLCTTYLHRKGIWRIRLNQMCEVVEVVSGAKGGPPVRGEISFKGSADGTPPSFGTLDRLDAAQTTYAKSLIKDLENITQAREVAKMHADAAQAAGIGAIGESQAKHHLEKMTAKVGELPAGATEVREAKRQQEAEEAALRARQLEQERRKALAELGVGPSGGLDDALEKDMARAQKKAEKKARQRAKKREAQLESAAATAAADESAVDDEVAAFEALLLGGSDARSVRVGDSPAAAASM